MFGPNLSSWVGRELLRTGVFEIAVLLHGLACQGP